MRERTSELRRLNRVLRQEAAERRGAAEERLRLLAQLDRERRLLDSVLQQLPVGVIIAEAPDGRVLFSNTQIEQILGYAAPSSEIGRYSDDWTGFRPDGSAYASPEWPLARAILHGEVVRDEPILFVTPSGERVPTEVNAVPVRDDVGRVVAGVVTIAGVSERRRTEEELRRAKEAAEEASRLKSDFMSVISHELRTPLTAVIGYAELLEMGIPEPIGDRAREIVERIRLSAGHQAEIMEEVLTFSRIEAGREKVRPREIDLDVLLSEIAAVIEPLAEKNALRFTVERAPLPAPLETDPGKLRQILLNLLGNAVKSTQAAEATATTTRWPRQ